MMQETHLVEQAERTKNTPKIRTLVPGGISPGEPETGLAIIMLVSLVTLWGVRKGFKSVQAQAIPINVPSAVSFASYLIIISTMLRLVAVGLADKKGVPGAIGKGLSFAI